MTSPIDLMKVIASQQEDIDHLASENAALKWNLKQTEEEARIAVAHSHKNVLNAWRAERNWRAQVDYIKAKWMSEQVLNAELRDQISRFKMYIKLQFVWEHFIAWNQRQIIKEEREEWSHEAREGKRKHRPNSPGR